MRHLNLFLLVLGCIYSNFTLLCCSRSVTNGATSQDQSESQVVAGNGPGFLIGHETNENDNERFVHCSMFFCDLWSVRGPLDNEDMGISILQTVLLQRLRS